MSSHDYVIANDTGANVRADVNLALLAIQSQNSGGSEPSTTYAYQFWADTGNDLLKQRNAANNAWISLITLSTGAVTATAALATAANSLTLGSDAQGDIAYRGSSDYDRLAKGTANQLLQMNSGATAPEWTTALTGVTIDGDTSTISDLPYDVGFTAGFDKDMVKEDVAVATYGELAMARAGDFVGEAGYVDTAPTGAILIVNVYKNGTTIYTTAPQFAISATSLTAGTLKSDGTQAFVAGDRITFKVTQIGSSEPGEGVRFTMKGKV